MAMLCCRVVGRGPHCTMAETVLSMSSMQFSSNKPAFIALMRRLRSQEVTWAIEARQGGATTGRRFRFRLAAVES